MLNYNQNKLQTNKVNMNGPDQLPTRAEAKEEFERRAASQAAKGNLGILALMRLAGSRSLDEVITMAARHLTGQDDFEPSPAQPNPTDTEGQLP
jgi:hypothetical protein